MIAKARRLRKMLGGGMRQAGILAAAGLIALDTMIDRLEEDHRRARLLAEGLRTVPGLRIDKGTPYTNMVYLVLEPDVRADAAEIVSLLKERGVLIGDTGKRTFRLVTHHDIDDEALEVCVQEFSRVMRSL